MSTLHQRNGAQLLPHTGDQTATLSPWVAESCISADQRTKHPEYSEVAASLIIHGGAA